MHVHICVSVRTCMSVCKYVGMYACMHDVYMSVCIGVSAVNAGRVSPFRDGIYPNVAPTIVDPR